MEFPEIPADLSVLSDDELEQLHTELQEAFAAATADNSSPDDETIAELTRVTEAVENIRTEIEARAEQAANRAATVADLAARVAPTDPDAGDPDPEATTDPDATVTAEPEPEVTPEPVAAGGRPAPVVVQARSGPAPLRDLTRPVAMQVREPERPHTTITAAADVPGTPAGAELADVSDIAEAIIRRHEAFRATRSASGYDAVPVATAHANWPEERMLRSRNPQENGQRIEAVTGPEAITAAGGLCAPLQPYYQLQRLGTAARPVRDALAGFGADRGGIIVMPPPKWEETVAGVGYITEAADTTGGAGATKPCLTVTCPSPVNYEVAAISRCLQFGNFGARAYPELVENWLGNVMTAWAARAERALLDGISTCSTLITAAKTVGSTRQLIAQVAKAAAYYRSVNRMDPNARLRVMFPAYVRMQVVSDMAHGSGYEAEFVSQALALFESALSEVGVNISYYLDSATGDAQVMSNGARETNNSAMNNYPPAVVWYMFAEGNFLFLDGGTLDLGVVRDSVLNPLNNYQIFAESWEQVACVGVESLKVVSTVVADGTFSPAGTAPGSF